MGVLLAALLALQDPGDGPVDDLLRGELEEAELAERLAQLGPEAAAAIARRLVAEAGREGATAPALAEALARIEESRAARAVLLAALRDPRAPLAGRVAAAESLLRMDALDPAALDDEGVPAEVRLTIAEGLWRRGGLAPVESVLRAVDRLRREAAVRERADALAGRLRRGEEAESVVVDLPDPPAPVGRRPRPEPGSPSPGGSDAGLLLAAGAVALIAALLAVRRSP